MAALTRHLAYFAPSNLQNRLIGILIECAGLEWDHALSTELSKVRKACALFIRLMTSECVYRAL